MTNLCTETLQPGDSTTTVMKLPTIGSVIRGRIPHVDEIGQIFSDSSIVNTIQVTPEQAKFLESLEMTEATIQLKDKTVTINVDPADPSPSETVTYIKEEVSGYARGETPVIAHIDELPYYKTEGPVGVPGLKGDDDSGLNADYDGNATKRKQKRKKSKPKSSHLPNMSNRIVKAALGASILGKLGAIQQRTSDANKLAILKDAPLSTFVEAVTGKELPAYQRRLLDLNQARAEGTLKPEISEALGNQSPEEVARALKPLYDQTIAAADKDGELAKALYPDLPAA